MCPVPKVDHGSCSKTRIGEWLGVNHVAPTKAGSRLLYQDLEWSASPFTRLGMKHVSCQKCIKKGEFKMFIQVTNKSKHMYITTLSLLFLFFCMILTFVFIFFLNPKGVGMQPSYTPPLRSANKTFIQSKVKNCNHKNFEQEAHGPHRSPEKPV